MYGGSFKRQDSRANKQPFLKKVLEPGLAAMREVSQLLPRMPRFIAVIWACFLAVFRWPAALLAFICRRPLSVSAVIRLAGISPITAGSAEPMPSR